MAAWSQSTSRRGMTGSDHARGMFASPSDISIYFQVGPPLIELQKIAAVAKHRIGMQLEKRETYISANTASGTFRVNIMVCPSPSHTTTDGLSVLLGVESPLGLEPICLTFEI